MVSPRVLLNLFLGLAFVGLLALAIYEPGKPEAPAAKLLTQLDPAAVQQLLIEVAGRPAVHLQKQSGHWQMLSPFAMPANAERVSHLLNIVQAKSQAEYPMSKVDANQLQLDAPKLTLQLDDLRLRFGGTDALGGSRYVQVGNVVHLIADRFSHLARGAATDFVSPRLLTDESNINDLSLPAMHLTQHDGRWQVDGKEEEADRTQALVDEWRYARAQRVSALDTTQTPSHTIQLVVADAAHADGDTLQFGLVRTDTEIILQRADLGIQYHFSQDMGKRLLELPQAAHPSAS